MTAGFRLERRQDPPLALRVALPVGAIGLGFIAGGIIMLLGGHDPINAYGSMWDASLGSSDGLTSTFIKATPLIFTGLAVAAALRVGLWNIGGEGQLIIGAVGATGIGLFIRGLPGPALLVLMMVGAVAAGAAWALIAAILRALIGLNEIIVTLFLNYIAILLMDNLIFGPWGDPKAFGFAYSRALPIDASLPLIPGTGLHIGILIALASAGLLWWLIGRTPWGFSIRVTGGNERAAKYLRLPIRRQMIVVFALSGALAGLAGAIELTGVTHRLQEGISVSYGYTGVLIAFLARERFFQVVVAAFLFAALVVGSFALQTTGVAQPIVTIIQAMTIVFLLAGDTLLVYRVRIVRRARLAVAPAPTGSGAES